MWRIVLVLFSFMMLSVSALAIGCTARAEFKVLDRYNTAAIVVPTK